MNNLIKVNGNIEFMGCKIPNIEGGFKNGRVILAKTIAEIHNVQLKHVNELINNNIDEFEFGVDIINLKSTNISADYNLIDLGFTKMQIAKAKSIYLLSESGYFLLVGFMKSEKAKEIRKQLRRSYFEMREKLREEEIKKQYLLDIYRDNKIGHQDYLDLK